MKASWRRGVALALVLALALLYLSSLSGREELGLDDLEPLYHGQRIPLVFKCPGEIASPLLATRKIPHYFSLPLQSLEVEPLIQSNLFRSPPDPTLGKWVGEEVEDRGHLKMLPHSLHKFVC